VRVIVREPSDALRDALSTHARRDHIDPRRAIDQHRAFVAALAAAGLEIVALPPEPALPDATFVSDTLIALPRATAPSGPAALLVVTRPGAPSRRGEVASVAARAQRLAPGAAIVEIEEPGTLDGGDVIVFGDRVAIGVSGRTNVCGAGQLAVAVQDAGYRAYLCPVTDRLHLATAVTSLGAGPATGTSGAAAASSPGSEAIAGTVAGTSAPPTLLGTTAGFASLDRTPGAAPADEVARILVPDDEADAANVLAVEGRVLMAAGHPRTASALRAAGFDVVELALDEFALADGGPTCLVALVP
jgi:dimethylargininase